MEDCSGLSGVGHTILNNFSVRMVKFQSNLLTCTNWYMLVPMREYLITCVHSYPSDPLSCTPSYLTHGSLEHGALSSVLLLKIMISITIKERNAFKIEVKS